MRPLSAFALCFALAACGAPPSAKRAETLLDQGDFAGAEREAKNGLKAHPGHRDLWKLKIRSHLGRGDNRSAVDSYLSWQERRGGEHDRGLLGLMARSVLYQQLRVPAPDVRVAAIQVIERLEIEALATDVADRLGDDNDRVSAAAAVALLRSHPQAAKLAQQHLGSSDPVARRMVLRGLAKKLKGKARGIVVAALKDRDPSVRRAAVTALGAVASASDATILAQLLGDADPQIRARALRALVRAKLSANPQSVARLLDDRYLGAQLAAVEYLESQGKEHLDGFLVAATANPNLAVALRAAAALHKRGQGASKELVERALDSPQWPVRASAMNQLPRLVSPAEALRLAGVGLADRRIDVRLAAAGTLLRLGESGPAVAVLKQAMSSPTAGARLIAASELARRGDKPARQVIAALARSRSDDIRRRAIDAHRLLRLTTPALIAALADDSAAVRIQAAEVLLAVED